MWPQTAFPHQSTVCPTPRKQLHKSDRWSGELLLTTYGMGFKLGHWGWWLCWNKVTIPWEFYIQIPICCSLPLWACGLGGTGQKVIWGLPLVTISPFTPNVIWLISVISLITTHLSQHLFQKSPFFIQYSWLYNARNSTSLPCIIMMYWGEVGGLPFINEGFSNAGCYCFSEHPVQKSEGEQLLTPSVLQVEQPEQLSLYRASSSSDSECAARPLKKIPALRRTLLVSFSRDTFLYLR